MNNYQFKNLLNDLSCNREIEFEFNNIKYSITNTKDHWYFYNNDKDKSVKICEFKDKKILINFVENLIIDDKSLKSIFDDSLYIDLYIL